MAGRPECDGQSGAGGLGRGRRVRGCDESRRGVALESGAFGGAGRERRLHARSVHVVDLRPDLGSDPSPEGVESLADQAAASFPGDARQGGRIA